MTYRRLHPWNVGIASPPARAGRGRTSCTTGGSSERSFDRATASRRSTSRRGTGSTSRAPRASSSSAAAACGSRSRRAGRTWRSTCFGDGAPSPSRERSLAIGGNGHPGAVERPEEARLRMVAEQIESRGVPTPDVLQALTKVPRHLFVPEPLLPHAHGDTPLAIGSGQTISQPFIVAFMTDLLRPGAESKVLEVGTGSGYQSAILSEMGAELFTIEIVDTLAEAAKVRLTELGYGRIHFRAGDGYRG